MTPALERRALQAAVALAACVPASAGAGGIWLGLALTGASGDAAAASHMRYLSGLLFGIGILFWCYVPTIERRTREVTALTTLVVVGGAARFLGAVMAWQSGDGLSPIVLFALTMELVVTPALCAWQHRLAGRLPPR